MIQTRCQDVDGWCRDQCGIRGIYVVACVGLRDGARQDARRVTVAFVYTGHGLTWVCLRRAREWVGWFTGWELALDFRGIRTRIRVFVSVVIVGKIEA